MALTLKNLATPLLAASLFAAFAQRFLPLLPIRLITCQPSALAMMTDLIILRPLGTAATIVGAAAYVVSLPFTLPTGSASGGSVLVGEPAIYTFARCLGCTRPGYHPA